MNHEIFDPTIKTTVDDLDGPVENPGTLVEVTANGEKTWVLDRSIVILGSDEAADIVVGGRSIAPYHAEINHDSGSYRIRHIDGTTPVRVNGEPQRECVLNDGDAIAIADTTFSFRSHAPDPEWTCF